MPPGILQTKNYRNFRIGDFTFESAYQANRALPGDVVFLDDRYAVSIVKRASHKGLVGVLEVSSKTRYGLTSKGTPIYLFVPWNESYPPFYVGSNHSTVKPVLAVVDFESWAPTANCPRGNCRVVLGPCGDLATEEQALILRACPRPWKKSVKPPELEDRAWKPTSVVEGTTFHVDPVGCLDIDDAITFVTLESGLVDVYIHIADVASLLQPNPSLWRAAEIGQTLYNDGKVVAGLFPEAVEAACSLLPFKVRPTLTLKFVWNPLIRSIGPVTWLHAEIVVKKSYTYDTIYGTEHAAILQAIASVMGNEELADSHDWIAEFMQFYNKEAAAIVRHTGQGILRSHGAPDMELINTLNSLEFVPNYLAYQAGKYCEATAPDVFHWGLEEGLYCHASSPIRRYVDCINQLCIMRAQFGYEGELPTHSIEDLNAHSKGAKRYERDLFFMRNLLRAIPMEDLKTNIVECSEEKIRIWVDEWKILLKVVKPVQGFGFEPAVGQRVSAKVFMDPSKRNWKRRLVITLSG